jgi:L-arabinose transport system substrate-binding protein
MLLDDVPKEERMTNRRRTARILVLLAVFTIFATLAGAATTDGKAKGEKTVTIAYIQKQGDQLYFIDEANGAKKQAKKVGAKVIVTNVASDSDKAISAVQTAIAQKADGIAIVVPDQKIGPQVIDLAKKANIPLVASDDSIKSAAGKDAAFVGFNGTQMGLKVGADAARLYKASKWNAADTRVISSAKQDLSVCTDRTKAALVAFKKGVGGSIPKVINLGTDNSATDAQTKTGATVTANPGVKHWVVWGCNDENVSGVVIALANAGFGAKDVDGVGLGAYLACKDWKANQKTGFKSALFIDGHNVGSAAVEVLYNKVAKGKALPAKTVAKTVMVNSSNWKKSGLVCS